MGGERDGDEVVEVEHAPVSIDDVLGRDWVDVVNEDLPEYGVARKPEVAAVVANDDLVG